MHNAKCRKGIWKGWRVQISLNQSALDMSLSSVRRTIRKKNSKAKSSNRPLAEFPLPCETLLRTAGRQEETEETRGRRASEREFHVGAAQKNKILCLAVGLMSGSQSCANASSRRDSGEGHKWSGSGGVHVFACWGRLLMS